jgi:hypothetical protein
MNLISLFLPLLQTAGETATNISIPYAGPIITAILVILLIFVAVRFGRGIIILALNSLIGLIVLVLVNFLPFINISINIWSILIVAIGGIPGIALLILLDFFKIAF